MGGISEDVKLKLTADTSNIPNNLQGMIDAPKNGAISDMGLASVPGEKAGNNLISMNETFTSLNDVMNQVLSNFKIFNDRLKNANGNGGSGGSSGNGDVSGDNNIFKNMGNGTQRAIGTVLGAAGIGLSAYQGYNAYQRQMMRGNWLDAKVTGVDTFSNAASSIGSTLTSAGIGLMGTPVGLPLAIIGGLMSLGGLAGKGVSSYLQKENDEYNLFSENFTTFDQLQVAFDSKNKSKRGSNSWEDNTKTGFEKYSNLIESNNGLGLEDAEYMSLLTSMGRYTTDSSTATSNVRSAANLARATNGDVSSIANTIGYLFRYSGNNSYLETAYANGSKMGFSDTQFDELMQGIRSSMEKGVSKGFATNVTAIMDTVASFNAASGGNTFWSGEQAIKRVETFRDAMSNSKNLNSLNDVAMYKAVGELGIDFKSVLGDAYTGNTILDTRAYLEQGNVTPAFLNKLMSNLVGYYGNDSTALVTSLEGMGFSSNEAATYYNMWKKGGITDVALDLGSNGNFASATTYEQDYINSLTREVTTNNLEEQLGKIADTKLFHVDVVNNNKVGEYAGEHSMNNFVDLQTLSYDKDDKWLYNVMARAQNSDKVDYNTYKRMLMAISNNVTGDDGKGGYNYNAELKNLLQGILDEMRTGIKVEG